MVVSYHEVPNKEETVCEGVERPGPEAQTLLGIIPELQSRHLPANSEQFRTSSREVRVARPSVVLESDAAADTGPPGIAEDSEAESEEAEEGALESDEEESEPSARGPVLRHRPEAAWHPRPDAGTLGGSTSSPWRTTPVWAAGGRGPVGPRRSCLPTQRLQRALEAGRVSLEEEGEKERPTALVDLMLVIPVGPQPGDDEPLPPAGPDRANPAPGSACWFIKQIVCDDEVFTATSKRENLCRIEPAKRYGRGGPRTTMAMPQYFRPSVVVEFPLMKVCYAEALQEAETKGQLRERVLELLLRYLMSTKCCFHVRAFTGCDGEHLFLGIYADEVVLRGHADALGYQVQLDATVAKGLLRGSFKREELHPAHVRYDLEEEHKFRSLHQHTPFKSYFDTFGVEDGGSIFRSIDRIRIIERVISRVFNLEDMLERGFLTARYSCHSTLQQRTLAQTWATPRLLHSPSVPLNEICDYLGEAVTFRLCFLSFTTRALLPVVAIALVVDAVPDYLASPTALSMVLCVVLALWGTLFFRLWLRTERYWIMAWGMDTFKKREASRPRFIGTWGVSVVDRYTIVKVAPWTRQFYRRALTCVATCLFNLSVIGFTVALFGYRHRLLQTGHSRLAQIVYYLNASQMLVFDTIWGYVAISFTDFDNYATDSEYTERVIQRIFVTRFINSFASLFYIALVKHFVETCEDGYGCNAELASQLRVLFGASMARSVLRAAFSYTWFRVSHRTKLLRARQRRRSTGYSWVSERCQQSSLEIQASMPEFSLSEDVEDCMDLIIELGFVLFFGCVAPEIIWLFCVSNLIRIRAWGWKLLFAVRRPFPSSSAGLGTLNKVISLMSMASVWCNILLCLSLNLQYRSSKGDILSWLEQIIGYTADIVPEEDVNWKALLPVFLVLERTLFFARGLIDYCLIHISGGVELEEKRRDAMITAYYKLIIEDAKVEENQGMAETSVEALVPVSGEPPGALSPRAWCPVGVERILRASRDAGPEADADVPPFTSRDPGFEHPWDEQDTGDEEEPSLLASPCCGSAGLAMFA